MLSQQSGVKISVITATWNCEATVVDCLNSVAEQTWPLREHVVIDGASSDNTVAILDRYRSQLAVLVSEKDAGIYDALNKGIARSTGDVIGFLHADDLFAHRDVLSHVALAFSDPAVGAVYGDLQYVRQGDVNHVVRNWQSMPFNRRNLPRGWMPPHPTLYVRREWYAQIGNFDTKYRISADYFSVLQLFSHPNLNPAYLPEVMIKMRLGGASNRSLSNIIQKSQEDLNALHRSGVGSIGALAFKNLSKLRQFWV